MAARVDLLVVDPQNDFCDPKGSLFVTGADGDMERVGALLRRVGDRLERIHVTLDTHHAVDVGHPVFWVDADGNHPAPFTIITAFDLDTGRWMPTNPAHRDRMRGYVRALAENGRYPLCIWPPHCLIGSWGHTICEPVSTALVEWEVRRGPVHFVVKGTNPFTEHYSAVQADVPDASDPSTLPNTRLLRELAMADVVAVAGEALSHCVANTIRDFAARMGKYDVEKFVLLSDCTSPVPGFEREAEAFLREMTGKGMRLETSAGFPAAAGLAA